MNVNHRMRNGEWMFDSAGQNAPGQALASRGWGRFNLNNPATAAVIVGLLSVPWVFGLASLKTEPETSNRVLSDPGTVVGIMGFLTVLTVCGVCAPAIPDRVLPPDVGRIRRIDALPRQSIAGGHAAFLVRDHGSVHPSDRHAPGPDCWSSEWRWT